MWPKQSLFLLFLVLSACQSTAPPPRSEVAPHRHYRIIGYVYGERADMNAISAQKLTHINYAFAKVNPIGLAELENPKSPAHLAQLQALKARNPDLKIIVSIGGWGADFFSDAAVTEASRCNFAMSAVKMLKDYALDGIDLDWEYPGQAGPGMIYRAEDKENFTAMLRTLREELDMLSDARHRTGFDRYTLSIASSAGEYFAHTEMEKLHPYVDWFNVMTYDFSGDWSQTTAHHTALYRSASSPPNTESTEAFVKQHLAAGIPPKKIVVGSAFYGKGWIRSKGLYQSYDRFAYEEHYPYSRIASLTGYERKWDESAAAPYLWSAETGRLITYDDPRSVTEKANFVKRYDLGGIMYWEHSEDPAEVLLNAMYAALQ